MIQLAGLNTLGRFRPSRNNKCEDPQRHDGMDKAKLTKQPFGDLRIYFDGPTDHLKSLTAAPACSARERSLFS